METTKSKNAEKNYDVILIGAGLANSFLALRLKQLKPEMKVLALEKRSSDLIAKTWSCHGSDLIHQDWAQSHMSQTWQGYDVEFPKYRRSFASPYHSLDPLHLHQKLKATLGADLRYESDVIHSSRNQVTLSSQVRWTADCVIDSSMERLWKKEICGFQKFVGLHVELKEPHRLTKPILMQARVPQLDGFRFFYVLPLSPQVLLVEDTRYSEDSELAVEDSIGEIKNFISSHQWQLAHILKREQGVLPLPFHTHPEFGQKNDSSVQYGMAAGYFHPVTGYSLPDAVRLADRIAKLNPLTTETARKELDQYAVEMKSQNSFLFFLNRMMFQASTPEKRYLILERFYSLSENLISRFYRGQLTTVDQARILIGKPPVPISKAIQCLFKGGIQ